MRRVMIVNGRTMLVGFHKILAPEANRPTEMFEFYISNPHEKSKILETTTAQPSFGTNSFMTLDPRSRDLEQVSWWFLTGIVGGILLAAWFLAGFLIRGNFDAIQWLLLLPIILLLAVGMFASSYFPAKVFRATSWQLNTNGLEIRRGIWWRHRIFVPRDRIQHTDVKQGPLMRKYGLAELVINTGGTHEPSIPLSGLTLAVAEQLRDNLSVRKTHEFTDSRPTNALQPETGPLVESIPLTGNAPVTENTSAPTVVSKGDA